MSTTAVLLVVLTAAGFPLLLWVAHHGLAGHDLRGSLRAGASDQELRGQIAAIWARRADCYSQQRTRRPSRTCKVRPKMEMSQIGGWRAARPAPGARHLTREMKP
jgi:hypothetical protein